MKAVIVGTAGHIDHGKSALVRALTGTDPDRLEEEKRRGITIDIGFANLDLTSASGEPIRIGFVDVPGHERFVRNMLAGVGGIDLVLLVIAADEGIKPQTREHFDICRIAGGASRHHRAHQVGPGGRRHAGGGEARGGGVPEGLVPRSGTVADCCREFEDWSGTRRVAP